MLFIAFSLEGLGRLPFASIICLEYFICDLKDTHFSGLSLKPYSFILSNIFLMCSQCCLRFSLFINTSPKYAMAKLKLASMVSIFFFLNTRRDLHTKRTSVKFIQLFLCIDGQLFIDLYLKVRG